MPGAYEVAKTLPVSRLLSLGENHVMGLMAADRRPNNVAGRFLPFAAAAAMPFLPPPRLRFNCRNRKEHDRHTAGQQRSVQLTEHNAMANTFTQHRFHTAPTRADLSERPFVALHVCHPPTNAFAGKGGQSHLNLPPGGCRLYLLLNSSPPPPPRAPGSAKYRATPKVS